MQQSFIITLLALAIASASAREEIEVTPHDRYSSSIGVIGCFIKTNRVAYFPTVPSCEHPCVRRTHKYSGRQLTLLRIDQSQGAYDISYDAWNILGTSQSATEAPALGNSIPVYMEPVAFEDPECQGLLQGRAGGKIPLMASSPNWGLTCQDKVRFFNFRDPICSLGSDEECALDKDGVIQCPNGVGMVDTYNGPTVTDIPYGDPSATPLVEPEEAPYSSTRGGLGVLQV